MAAAGLGQVDVELSVVVGPLHVLPLYQALQRDDQEGARDQGLHLDPLLDDEGAGLEPLVELLDHLGDQLVVVQLLPALHDPHDARLDLVFPVLVHLVCKFCASCVQVCQYASDVQDNQVCLLFHLLPGLVPLRLGLARSGARLVANTREQEEKLDPRSKILGQTTVLSTPSIRPAVS